MLPVFCCVFRTCAFKSRGEIAGVERITCSCRIDDFLNKDRRYRRGCSFVYDSAAVGSSLQYHFADAPGTQAFNHFVVGAVAEQLSFVTGGWQRDIGQTVHRFKRCSCFFNVGPLPAAKIVVEVNLPAVLPVCRKKFKQLRTRLFVVQR